MAENKVSKTLLWFVGGVAVGAAVGVLVAPQPGSQTRADVADWLRRKREQTKELANKLREKLPSKQEPVVAYQNEGGNHRVKEPVAA